MGLEGGGRGLGGPGDTQERNRGQDSLPSYHAEIPLHGASL